MNPKYRDQVGNPETDYFFQGLIYTGCQDGVIRAFDPRSPEPVLSLIGHSANVVSLFFSKVNSLLSGSWDHSAKVSPFQEMKLKPFKKL
jgi:WD40 repeat protein